MSDHNPSDSFDSHPESSGCSNDDFEQLEVPGYQDNGEADGPDEYDFHHEQDVRRNTADIEDDEQGAFDFRREQDVHRNAVDMDDDDQGAFDFRHEQDAHRNTADIDDDEQGAFDFHQEQDVRVSTTTGDLDEDEVEEDRFGAGASEAEMYGHHDEPLISFGDEADDEPQEHPLQASAPVPDAEPALDFANTFAADIMSSVTPPTPPAASNLYDEFDDYAERQETDLFPDTKATAAASATTAAAAAVFDQQPAQSSSSVADGQHPEKLPTLLEDSVSSTTSISSSSDLLAQKKKKEEADRPAQETATGCCCFKNIDPRVVDLIYWRDVKKSGSVFGALLVVLLSLAVFTVISVLSYLSLAVLTVTFTFVVYKKIMAAVQKSNDGHPFRSLLEKDIDLYEDRLKSVIPTIVNCINFVTWELRHLFLVEDVVDTVKFGVFLWLLTYIGSWFSDMSLIIISFLLVFSVPKFYETYQVQIDNSIGLAKVQINKYLSIIQSKLPFLKKKEKSS